MSNVEATPEAALDAQLVHLFTFHPPRDAGAAVRHGAARAAALEHARKLVALLGPCLERDRALEHVREAMFWINAGIACEVIPPAEVRP